MPHLTPTSYFYLVPLAFLSPKPTAPLHRQCFHPASNHIFLTCLSNQGAFHGQSTYSLWANSELSAWLGWCLRSTVSLSARLQLSVPREKHTTTRAGLPWKSWPELISYRLIDLPSKFFNIPVSRVIVLCLTSSHNIIAMHSSILILGWCSYLLSS